ncbi:MAG: DUF362 domain-containing protein [Clostridiales bacterium]|nr:DUF362 domain-containing protein [Clostridiales bacterium]
MKADVVITPCADYSEGETRAALERVLEPLGGLDWVGPGMKIAVKVNLVTFAKPEKAATTHPGLLCSLVKMLVERGADVVVGDSPGGLYNAAYVNRVYAATGMNAVERCGGRLNQDFSERQGSCPEGKVCRQFRYTAYLDEADAIIDLCKLKTHGMMAMTCGAKNMFGTIPGTMKPEYHFRYPDPRDFARMIVDLDEYFKPKLTIVDAVDCMEGNGPTGGTPRHMGALLASESPHKVDLVCAELIGLKREEVPTLEAALERGLIPASAEELTVEGDPAAFALPDFQRITTGNSHLFQGDGKSLFHRVKGSVMQWALSQRPAVKKAECVGCGECRDICPAKAITMVGGKPSIDRKACIRCFCCQEFCPKSAMVVRRTAIAKLLDH